MTSTTHPNSAAAAMAAKFGLYDTIVAALADEEAIDIDFGFRYPMAFPDAVAIAGVRTQPGDPNPNTRRSQFDTIEIDVNIISERAGFDGDAEKLTTTRAYEILGLINTYIRTGDNITLGDAVVGCVLGPTVSAGASDEDDQSNGIRVTEIAATFIATAYVRNS